MPRLSGPLGLALRILAQGGGGAGGYAHTPGPYVPVTDTLTLPDTRVLRIRMDGQDANGEVRTVYNWAFATSDKTVFTIQDTDDDRIKVIVPGPDLARTGTARSATLTVTGTPDADLGATVLTRIFTITVIPGLAVEIVVTISLSGGPAFRLLSDFDLPLNETATATMNAVDSKGRSVAVTNVAFTGGGARYHIVATADPKVVTLVPDSIGGASLAVTCDPDVTEVTGALEADFIVSVVQSVPTTLAGLYDIEIP